MAVSTRLGRAAALACGLVCLLLTAAPAEAVEDPAAPMFQPYAVDVIDLQLPQASIETLEAEPEENYVEATFSMAESDGTPGGVGPFSTPITVGVRLKGGNGSFRDLKDEKAAFKIKFNQVKGQKFLGLKKLTLNNMVQDPSMLHETMTYEAFRALGVPAPRTGFANVYVNGVNYGVHLNVETYDDVSLPRWFGSTQHLYEADKPGVDVRPGSQGEFEVDEGDPPLTDLEALVAAANDEAGDWSVGMGSVADLDEMTHMWAVERYVGHWDGYAGMALPFDPPVRPNNYYLHSDESGLFSMLPWGTDQTWVTEMEFDEPAGGLLFNDCLTDSSCASQYVEALRQTQGAVAGLELGAQATCLAVRLAPWQAMEDADRREYDEEEIAAGVEEAEEFIAERPGELSTWLATQPGEGEGSAVGGPAPCGPPKPGPFAPGTVFTFDPSPSSQASLPPGPSLRFVRFARGRQVLKTVLDAQGSGRLVEVAKMQSYDGVRRACLTRLWIDSPGELTVRCRLTDAAWQRRLRGSLNLDVSIRFIPEAGPPESYLGRVGFPRLSPR